ncbi:MAG TPA: TadE/TadG family type IV pilus assembly protein [Beijerinckiaceae bacterium]|jgi:Flp pilus assembly protein TadG
MFKRFANDSRGAILVLFAFALVPLLAVVGVALDYSRSTRALTDLQSAVDGAALAAGKNTLDESRRDITQIARAAFDAAFRPESGVKVTGFKAKVTQDRIAVEAAGTVPTMFGGFIGKRLVDIEAKAEVPLGIMSLEIALVLDNTGSMARLGKMDALKQAAKSLIDTIQATPGSANSSFALVTFNTQVNVGDTNRYASWLRFTPPGGPEPKLEVTQAAWTGCVADRDQPQDARDTLPSTGRPETLYPAAPCQYPGLLPIIPLSRDFAAMKTAVDAMNPTGNTNTGIGLAWGLSVLTPGAPLSGIARAPSARVQKIIVFLTDGLNTENRWTKTASDIDKRTEKLCNEVKSAKIRLYTIRVIEGNENLLRDCATSKSMYFSVNQASELKEVFDKIAADLTTLRLSF